MKDCMLFQSIYSFHINVGLSLEAECFKVLCGIFPTNKSIPKLQRKQTKAERIMLSVGVEYVIGEIWEDLLSCFAANPH